MDEMLMLTRRRQLSEVGRFAFPWLIDVGRRFKERGVFPLSLTDYYSERDDIIVSGIVDALIPDGCSHDRLVMDILSVIGSRPSELVQRRLFVTMSPPDDDEHWLLVPVLSKRDIAQALSWTYDAWHDIERALLDEFNGDYNGEHSIFDICNGGFQFRQRLRMSIARLTLRDGFGKGVWDSTSADMLQCPLTDDVLWLLRHFYRLEGIDSGNVNEILQYIGFDVPVEFMYTVWGVNEMRKKHKHEIDTFLRSFREHTEKKSIVRYCSGTKYYLKNLKSEIPDIQV